MIRSLVCAAVTLACAWSQPKPAEPELKYAVIVSRHGVRAPTWTLDRLNRYSTSPWPEWGVPPANLTPHGRELMKIMGTFYREHFASQQLLSKSCADAKSVHIRADIDQRTLETARAISEGMLPGCNAPVQSGPPDKEDPLFDPISAGVAKPDVELAAAAVKGRIGPRLEPVIEAHRAAFDELTRVLNGNGTPKESIFDQPPALAPGDNGLDMSGPLRLASTLTENLLLEYTNGTRGAQLGWGRLNATSLQQIMALHTAYADLMRRTPYLAGVRGSNLLSHILRSIEQAAGGKPVKGALGKPGTALVVLSGHDTNISNLSGMLGLSWTVASYQPDDVPPGGALIFTLWRARAGGSYSVRLQFVTQTLDQMHDAHPLTLDRPPVIADIFIPGCSTAQKGFACEWSAFQKIVRAAIQPAFVQ